MKSNHLLSEEALNASVFKANRIPILALIIATIMAFSVYVLLNIFFHHAAREVIESWYHNEAVNLQQGNILSTITKLQRGISETSLLRGAVAVDTKGRELARVGKLIPYSINRSSEEYISELKVGAFQSQFQVSTDSLMIIVFMASPLLRSVLVGVIFYFLIVILCAAFFFRHLLLQQEKLKSEIGIKAIREKLTVAEAVACLGRQVAHDIRSPLMALEAALKDTSGLSPERRHLLEQVNSRIKSIAEDLLSKSRELKAVPLVVAEAIPIAVPLNIEVNSSILAIVAEMNISFSGGKIEFSGFDQEIHVFADQTDFQRVLSNLIQNAIESVSENHEPRVHVGLRKYASRVQVTIIDNGKGIPGDILPKIGEEGFSFGKAKGNGLGVSFANRKMMEWGGELQISSCVGQGTMVTLGFPINSLSAQQSV
jgi:signal transduction histidine kinase